MSYGSISAERNRLSITDREKACQPDFVQPFITWP